VSAPDDRQFALGEAIDYFTSVGGFQAPLETRLATIKHIADEFYAWLTVPSRLQVAIDRFTYPQHGGPGTPTLYREGHPNMATLTDTQQVALTVAETDAKGEPVTADTLVWTVDNPDVITLTVAPDTYSAEAVAGAPGTAIVTVADAANPALTGTVSFFIKSGAATSLVITEGTPEEQPPPAP
jgi:hypothetical protein